MTTADMLRELGHEPIETTSANKALELLKAAKSPDPAIFDYAMPEMTGLMLAGRIRERYPTLPLLLATGYAVWTSPPARRPAATRPPRLADRISKLQMKI